VKNPTEAEMVAEYQRVFSRCTISNHERAFLAFIHIARSHGVGFGWMRQAIGLAWRLADPLGYIDDDRVIALHTPDSKAAGYREGIEAAAKLIERGHPHHGGPQDAERIRALLQTEARGET